MTLTREQLKGIEWARWGLLSVAFQGGAFGASDEMSQAVIADERPMTIKEIRAELHYLEERQLIKITKHDVKAWRFVLTNHGRDFVDGTIAARPGIYRPVTGA